MTSKFYNYIDERLKISQHLKKDCSEEKSKAPFCGDLTVCYLIYITCDWHPTQVRRPTRPLNLRLRKGSSQSRVDMKNMVVILRAYLARERGTPADMTIQSSLFVWSLTQIPVAGGYKEWWGTVTLIRGHDAPSDCGLGPLSSKGAWESSAWHDRLAFGCQEEPPVCWRISQGV